ncbi:hypothetical protein CO230_05560 [Chryseobacterium sp. 6424]|nr:hypothetical protein CO230_05560 [Chryseobacterium sp. 6424]
MRMNEKGEEVWKQVAFDFDFTNDFRLEVSNLGQVRTFNKVAEGRILKGSMTEGYKVIRLKLYRHRDEKDQVKFDELKKEISELHKIRRNKIRKLDHPESVERITQLIQKKKASLSKRLLTNLKKRTINHHFMVHRLVATYFLPPPTEGQIIVTHLDYDKTNNVVTNLKWMTQEEHQLHQSANPKIIALKKYRKYMQKPRTKGMKLTSSQVIHIKLLLRRKKTSKQIAKQFNISEMQVWRIKSGENWANVQIPDADQLKYEKGNQ